jgi:hypothetical protein
MHDETRWRRWLPMAAVLVVVAGCGSARTITVTSTPTAANTNRTVVDPSTGWSLGTLGNTTTPRLPYDPEEDAFMGQFSWTNGHDTSTGCLAEIDDQIACDCAYRRLRADGYPASQLAAVGSGITIEDNLTAHDPPWMARTIVACNLDEG